MGALLSDVAMQLEDDQYWSEVDAACERLQRDNPAGWAEYLAELVEWEAARPR